MNYIIFQPDELRAETLHCYGNKAIRTPYFDALAENGVTFEQCHVQNPVCSPSRCSMFTGQYVHTYGHRTLWNLLKPDEHNLLRYMREAGYEVRVYGKNDLFSPEAGRLSTDIFIDTGHGKDYIPPRPLVEYPDPGCYTFLYQKTESPPGAHSDYQNVRAGIDFIKSRKPTDKPFVLFLPLLFPHCAYTASAPYYNMYSEKEIMPLRPTGEGKPEYHALIRQYRELALADLEKIQAVYMGMTTCVDNLLGELMACVRSAGIGGETMVIATSDHGDYAGDYGLVEKWPSGCEDVLTRVPLIISGPGCEKGHRVREQVELFDIMATMMDLAGIPAQHTHNAQSLVPQLHGAAGDPQRAVFCEGGYNRNEPQCNEGVSKPGTEILERPEFIYYPKGRQQAEHPESVGRATMIRTLAHKLVLRTYGDHELYDLEKDPRELVNVYGKHEYEAIRQSLEHRMLEWYIATSDSVPFQGDKRGISW